MTNLPKQHLNIHIQNIISDSKSYSEGMILYLLFRLFVFRLKKYNILQNKKYYKTYPQPSEVIWNKINLIVTKHTKYVTITIKLFVRPNKNNYKDSMLKINIYNSPKEIFNILTLIKLNPEYMKNLIKINSSKKYFSPEAINSMKKEIKMAICLKK